MLVCMLKKKYQYPLWIILQVADNGFGTKVKTFLLLTVLLLSALLPQNLMAQQGNLKFTHISTQDGLSQVNVTCILQDSRGFMWFGTRDGLNRYDGYKFKVYKNVLNDSSSLSNNFIQALMEDSKGNIWVGTLGGGINKFDRVTNSFTSYQHNPKDPNSISSNSINKIIEDHQGNLWIATYQGLNLFDTKSKRFTSNLLGSKSGGLNDDYINDVHEDSQHNLWIGTLHGGLKLFDRVRKEFISFKHDDKNSSSLTDNYVWRVFEDSKHRMWIATRGGGLDLFNKHTKTFQHYKSKKNNPNSLAHNTILAIAEDGNGYLWIGTENGGLCIFNPAEERFITLKQDEIDNSSLSNNSIYSIYKDVVGNMWVGSFSGGISLYNKSANKFRHYKHKSDPASLNNNFVLCFYEDEQNNLWIGTDGGGVNLFNRANGSFTHYTKNAADKKSVGGNYIITIEEDVQKNLWMGSWGDGISVLDKKKNTFTYYKNDPANPASLCGNNVYALLKARDGKMWVGTFDHGLDVFDPATKQFTHYKKNPNDPGSISSNNIYSFLEDSKGNMWVGTYDGGLNLYNKQTNSFTRYIHTEQKGSISNNSINHISEDHLGNIWISTFTGLNLFNRATNTFTVYNTKSGLPGEMIFSVLEDEEGYLWISTNKGISKFDPKTKTFKNYTTSDGVQGEEFKPHAALKSRNGALYFGGINGFNEFYPKDIKESVYTAPIYITNFQIFNKPVAIASANNPESPLKKDISETKEIRLNYDQSVISFEFASLDYTYQQSLQYAYMLEGFDKGWNVINTNRTATYTNLDPGVYVFKVKTLNEFATNRSETSIRLIITPPFWKTWWFIVLAFLFIAGCIVVVFRLRMRLIRTQKAELERQVKERTERLEKMSVVERQAREEAETARQEAEKANKAKSIFLATMSHEIRTPMNGVMGTASLLAETPLNEEQRKYMKIIRSSGDNLLSVINDILDFSKIESGKMLLEERSFDLRLAIEEVLDLFASKATQAGLDLIYEIDQKVPQHIIGDTVRLKQILINLVGNAVKFTEKGEVFIYVYASRQTGEKTELTFEVRDTGIGIAEDKIKNLFDAFTQVDSSTTRKYGGSGLGLAISKRLVELMGGQIAVQSEVNKHTTFRFTIQTMAGAQTLPAHKVYDIECISGKNILVVDDNETNRYILENQLVYWNLKPTTAASAREALDMLADKDFDLVITDMQMPEMDGLQLTRKIKQSKPHLPVVLLSSIGDERCAGYYELFSALLTKPVKQLELCKTILSSFQKTVTSSERYAPQQKLSSDFAAKYPLSVLIAEDNQVNQLLATIIMKKLGYKPDVAENGLKAVEALRNKHYDVILMDVQMPEMDGLEATSHIRKEFEHQPVIIATTANAMQDDQSICLNAGMDDYISKPIELDALVKALEKWARKIKAKQQQA